MPLSILHGAGETVRSKLLHECEVHTLLRLPTGLFYAQGVKANVLFFDKKPASETPWTKKLWIFDFRTNIDFTLKTNPLKREDLDEFVKCYNPENRHKRKATWSEEKPDGRWRSFDYDELINRDKASLDILGFGRDSRVKSFSLSFDGAPGMCTLQPPPPAPQGQGSSGASPLAGRVFQQPLKI